MRPAKALARPPCRTRSQIPRSHPGADHVRVRMAGIGGTGVVTVAQILATAAMLDGWEVRGLDQTGLSQKAGPVISDVVLARPGAISSNLVGARQAEVVLGFDALVAASDGAISAADPAMTTVIATTHRTPTGRMVAHPDLVYPTEAVEARLAAATKVDGNRFVDATALASALAGSAAAANVLLLGIAVQDGRIPVSVDAVERAIDLNGVAVDANLAAFDWGRRWAHDPVSVDRLAAAAGLDRPAVAMTVPDLPAALRSPRRGARRARRARRHRRHARCRPRRLPGRGIRRHVPRRGGRRGECRARRGRRLDPPDGGGGPRPAQADGLQGRVRGRPADAAARGASHRRCGGRG